MTNKWLIGAGLAAAGAAAVIMGAAAVRPWTTSLDVVRQGAQQAWVKMLAVADVGDEEQWWRLTAPDGEAKLKWRADAVMISVDAAPLVAVGLDVTQLTNVENGELVWYLMGEGLAQKKTTPALDGASMIERQRAAIGYHAALGHFGVTVTDGNLFEWAADMASNDKDIVWALDPEPLRAAGARLDEVAGWALALVPVDVDGETRQVEKLLKPFDLVTRE
jgi:hypothetical protein